MRTTTEEINGKQKSNENEIRAAVVSALLEQGVSRESIRLEIPLDTGSYKGRADIVVLTDRLGCIELKSGKDKYKHDDLRAQKKQYSRSFDGVISCVDVTHKREKEVKTDFGVRYESNWGGSVDYEYNHDTREVMHRYRFDGSIEDTLFRFGGLACTYDIACLLWRKEAQAIAGSRCSKENFVTDMRENGKLSELRPLVIEQLRQRELNKWEEEFWKFYSKTGEKVEVAIDA